MHSVTNHKPSTTCQQKLVAEVTLYLISLLPPHFPPGILLAAQVDLAVEGVVPGDLDGVALGVEVLELDLAALEPLPEVPGHLRERIQINICIQNFIIQG